MKNGIIGITSMSVECDIGIARAHAEFVAHSDYDFRELITTRWGDLFPGNVIVKCGHCGQWGAAKTECKHCGAAIG